MLKTILWCALSVAILVAIALLFSESPILWVLTSALVTIIFGFLFVRKPAQEVIAIQKLVRIVLPFLIALFLFFLVYLILSWTKS